MADVEKLVADSKKIGEGMDDDDDDLDESALLAELADLSDDDDDDDDEALLQELAGIIPTPTAAGSTQAAAGCGTKPGHANETECTVSSEQFASTRCCYVFTS